LIRKKHQILSLLRSVLEKKKSIYEINELIYFAHQLASTRLKQLIKRGKLHFRTSSLDLLAFDGIAELFERNNDGEFILLQNYFVDENALDQLTEEDAVHHFRSLVFTKLNDSISRFYRENDPVLSRIIRNIKSAVKKSSSINKIERFGEAFLFTCRISERNDHLPEIPITEFENLLLNDLKSNWKTSAFLNSAFEILNNQKLYRKFYSLIDLALIFKRFISQGDIPIDNLSSPDYELLQNDLKMIIEKVLKQSYLDLHNRYVSKEKLTESKFNKYFSAISMIIYDTVILSDGDVKNYFDYLSEQIPEITYEQYRTEDRIQFEYLTKLTKDAVKERLKELL